jgi:hypothetical protein
MSSPLANDEALRHMPKRYSFQAFYRLRWNFIWVDGKTKTGVWNGATNRFEDSAASINKSGLLVAQIHGEVIHHCSQHVLFECEGQDYVTAKWIAATGMGTGIGNWKYDAVTLEPNIIGLSFVTRKERVCVYVDGSASRRPNTDEEKLFKLREHTV